MKRPPVCGHCRGSRTNHVGDPDGCWCPACMKGPDERRCRQYVAEEPAPRTVVTTDMRNRAEAIAALRDGTIKHQMFRLLQVRGREGYTDDEMEVVLGKPHQTVSATRNALVAEGLAIDSGERRQTRYGAPATVWTIS